MCPSPSFNSHHLSAILFHQSPSPDLCVCAKALLKVSMVKGFLFNFQSVMGHLSTQLVLMHMQPTIQVQQYPDWALPWLARH